MFPLRDLNPSQRTPWVTWGIILLCVLVFVFFSIQPEWAQREITANWAVVPARLVGSLYEGFDAPVLMTAVTSIFMHAGIAHILANMWFLRVFGDNVEDNFGSARFAVFFLACGLAAVTVQVAIDPTSEVPMVGASGAIAGVLAAYLVLYPRARVLTVLTLLVIFPVVELPAFVLIAAWFGLQFVMGLRALGVHAGGGVAYWAHIGGFGAGLLLALLFRRRPGEPAAPATPESDAGWHARREWR